VSREAVRSDLARSQVRATFNVSHETLDRLDLLVLELRRWQSVKNLVSASTLDAVWTRHVADSLQLLKFAPGARIWLDLGSGGGFPGLVVAIERTVTGCGTTLLVESNGRKCAFLRHVARVAKLDVVVHEKRIEDVVPSLDGQVDVVSARALAPLTQLLSWTMPLLRNGALGIFPKGQDVEKELAEAATSWDYQADVRASMTDANARIVLVRASKQEQMHDHDR
jgi:16S rRNA (guanine527-N7)-methyltransferase